MAAAGKMGVVRVALAFIVGLVLSVALIRTSERRFKVRTVVRPLPETTTTTTTDLVNISTTWSSLAERGPEDSSKVVLLVLIFSRPDASGKRLRSAARGSWVSRLTSYEETTYKFVVPVGKADDRRVSLDARLVEEQRIQGDILFIAEEVTPATSSKQLLTALDWAMSRHFQFILKVSDASFVDISGLLQALIKINKSHLVWGYFRGNEEVTRSGPHSEKRWNLCRTYLPFPEGGGYVLSRDVVEMLTTMGPDLEHMDNEDTAVGVWTAPFDHIAREHDTRFNTGLRSRGCNNKYLITHPEDMSSMAIKHFTLSSEAKLCEKEFQQIQGYEFNWKAAADQCCTQKKDIP